MKPFLIVILSALTMTMSAQTSRLVTISVSRTNQTSEIQIQDYESFRVVSAHDERIAMTASAGFSLSIVKGATTFTFRDLELQGIYDFNLKVLIPPRPISMAGPAMVTLNSNFADRGAEPAFVTFEITPQSFPPGQTLIVPPGTNQVLVTLECSTNLVNWLSATNGVYGSPTEAKFFRIRGSKVQ
jgi:hypothetical protein